MRVALKLLAGAFISEPDDSDRSLHLPMGADPRQFGLQIDQGSPPRSERIAHFGLSARREEPRRLNATLPVGPTRTEIGIENVRDGRLTPAQIGTIVAFRGAASHDLVGSVSATDRRRDPGPGPPSS